LRSILSTDVSEGIISVFLSDIETDVEGEVEFSEESFSDHFFFDFFLFSGLVFLVLVVLGFEFVAFFFLDFDEDVGGFSEERFLLVFFDFLDFELFLVLFLVFSFSEHSFEAFSFLLEFLGLFFNSNSFVFHVSLSGGFLGSFEFQVIGNFLQFFVNFVLFLFVGLSNIFIVSLMLKSFFLNSSNFFSFVLLNLADLLINHVRNLLIHADFLDFTVLEVSQGSGPFFLFSVIFETESNKVIGNGFSDFDPSVFSSFLVVNISVHGLEAVGRAPSLREVVGSQLLDVDGSEQ